MDGGLDFSLSELIAVAPRTNHYREKIHDSLRSYFLTEGLSVIDRKRRNSNFSVGETIKGRIDWNSIFDDLSKNNEFLQAIANSKRQVRVDLASRVDDLREVWTKNLVQNSTRSPPGGGDRYHMSLLYWMLLPDHRIWNTAELNRIGNELSFEIFQMSVTEKVAKMRATGGVDQTLPTGLPFTQSHRTGSFEWASHATEGSERNQGWWDTAVVDAIKRNELKAVVFETSFDIVRLSPRNGRPLQKIKLDEEFVLSWSSVEEGYALAMQKFAGRWYPLWMSSPVRPGPATIPPSSEHQFLVESDHHGLHTFVVICSKSKVLPWSGPNHLSSMDVEKWLSSQVANSSLRVFASEIMFLA